MNNKGRGDMAQFSQAKGKETMSVELSEDVQSKAKKSGFNNDQVVTIFYLLQKGNKLKLPDARRPNEIGHTNDPKYSFIG